ncbi:MAG TPA: type II toxin-antitoxin system VapB family antitoxin [Vineibacter sp.]|nr:type II toxin-antitoxin system VapB family antitoxin [Vineibacter sp.]
MPLYIKDSAVAALAREYRTLTGARTTTDAVRAALHLAIDQVSRKETLREKIDRHRAAMRKVGKAPKRYDRKKFDDGLWGQ